MNLTNDTRIKAAFTEKYMYPGRMTNFDKKSPPECVSVFNANIVTKSHGKIWFGDINITREGKVFKHIAKEIGETLYVLKERDCRFLTELDPIEALINRAVWNTDQEILKNNPKSKIISDFNKD